MAELRLGEISPKVSEVARNALGYRSGDTARYASPIVQPSTIINDTTDPIPIGYPNAHRNQTPFWIKYANIANAGTTVSTYSVGSPITVVDFTVPANMRVVITAFLFQTGNGASNVNVVRATAVAEADVIVHFELGASSNFGWPLPTPIILVEGDHLNVSIAGTVAQTHRLNIVGFTEQIR